MKKFFAAAVFVSACAFVLIGAAGGAEAGPTKLSLETCVVELPEGWDVQKNDDGETVMFFNAEKTAVLSVWVRRPFDGLTSKELAESISLNLNGYGMRDNGDGLFRFDSMTDGSICRNLVGVYGGAAIVVTAVGWDTQLKPLAASLELKPDYRPNTASLF